MTCFRYLTFRYSGQNGAVRFIDMITVVKAAFSQMRTKLREACREIFFLNPGNHINIKGSKSGSVRNICILSDIVEFYMPGGVLASTQFIAYIIHFQIQFR